MTVSLRRSHERPHHPLSPFFAVRASKKLNGMDTWNTPCKKGGKYIEMNSHVLKINFCMQSCSVRRNQLHRLNCVPQILMLTSIPPYLRKHHTVLNIGS